MGNVKIILSKIKQSSLFKDSLWAIIGSVLGHGLSLLAGIIVARLIGKEVYGEYGVIKGTLTYIAIVSTFGFGYTATKYIAKYIIEDKSKILVIVKGIYRITLIFSSVMAVLLVIFAGKVAIYLESPHLELTLRISSVLIIFNAINAAQIGMLSGFKVFKLIARNNCYAGVVTFIFSVLLTYFYGLNGAVFALMIAFIFQTIINYILMSKCLKEYSHYRNIIVEKGSLIKEMLSFSLPIAMQESLYTIVHWLNMLILIKFANYGEVGLLSVASLWMSVVIFIPGVLKNVMFSHLSSTNDHSGLVNKLLLINLTLASIPILFVLLFSNTISSFYGETFIGLRPVLMVSVSSAIFVTLSEVFCYELLSRGRNWLVFASRFTRDILTLIISYFLIIRYNDNQAFIMAMVTLTMAAIYLLLLFGFYKGIKKYKIV